MEDQPRHRKGEQTGQRTEDKLPEGVPLHDQGCPQDGDPADRPYDDAPEAQEVAREHQGSRHRAGVAADAHLDDLIASFFMSLCRGQGLRTMAPVAFPDNPEHPAIIRPLALIPEELLVETAAENDFPAAGSCRYEEELLSGDRAYFRSLADTLTEKVPDFRSNFIRSLGHIEPEHLMITPALMKKLN